MMIPSNLLEANGFRERYLWCWERRNSRWSRSVETRWMREKQVSTSAGAFLIFLRNAAMLIEADRTLKGQISISRRDLITI